MSAFAQISPPLIPAQAGIHALCPGRAKRDPGPRAAICGPWVPAFGFLCERGFYVMKEKHERGLWCGRRPLWRGPTWRERRLGMLEDGGPAQIVDGSEREDVGGDIRQAGRAGTCEAVETFHRAEHRFHRRSPPRHQFVPARSPADDLALMLVGAMHDAVLDAERFEPRATCLAWIGAIAVDGAFITADQIVSDFAFIDARRGDDQASHQARALVDPDMRLVTQHSLAAAAGPTSVGLLRIDRTASGRHRRRLSLCADDGGIHPRACP